MKRQLVAAHLFDRDGECITFKFYNDGGISIYDHNSNEYLLPGDLSKRAYAFYVLKRIDYIKKYVLKEKEYNKEVGA